jgi:MoaA/NifB/PqqE/SkfB family radical SAM enzyme
MTAVERILFHAVKTAITSKTLRRGAVGLFEARLEEDLVRCDPLNRARFMQEQKCQWIVSLLRGVCRNLDRGYISSEYLQKALERFFPLFTRNTDSEMARVREGYCAARGMLPPSFVTISPTNACNLRCSGCYAACETQSVSRLPFETFDRIVQEGHDLWNLRMIVLSGGEPMMYRDHGRTIFDLFEKHQDMFFMFYTNGTLIDDAAASRMLDLGNVTPAISIEGLEEHTDARRGRGTFARILRAQESLRKYGVPFGLSVTATRKNARILAEDDFYDYWFDRQGGLYMWSFHLMPIGLARDTMDLMITPEERLAIRECIVRLIGEKQYTIADFWNSGILVDGCIAYGKQDGYIYIDWDGKIMPCVFVPYYEQTIQEIYARGQTLDAALDSPMMVRGRAWQCRYQGHPLHVLRDGEKVGNLLMPCSIRDHYENFRRNILTPEAKPEEVNARLALEDEEYRRRMNEFDARLSELSEPIWNRRYEEDWERSETDGEQCGEAGQT